MIPTEIFGRAASNVRPTAKAHWPTRISSVGADSGTVSLASVSTFKSTSMRLWSVATSLAAWREPSSSVTRIEAGFCTKLKALDRIYPSAETTRPVVGPVPISIRPMRSKPPTVSIRTTDGATRASAACIACCSRARRLSSAVARCGQPSPQTTATRSIQHFVAAGSAIKPGAALRRERLTAGKSLGLVPLASRQCNAGTGKMPVAP